MTDAPPTVSRRASVLLFFAALLPRLWALDWAFPLKTGHIDEAVVVFYSLRVTAGDPNPRVFFDYPGFFLYGLAALFKGVLLVARLVGQSLPPTDEILAAYTRGDGLIFLLASARAVSAVLGALISVLLLRIGASRWGFFAGLSAALLWAANPLAIQHAHYATVDMAATFLTLMAVERLAAYWEDGSPRDGLWAAFLIGLGAATKYYPAALVVFLLPAPFACGDPRPLRRALVLGCVSVVAFLAASPYALLAAPAFFQRFALLFPKIVGARGAGGGTFLLPTLKGLFSNAGAWVCAAGGAGMVLFVRSGRRGDRVLFGIFLFLLLFLGAWNAQLPHYALPLYPLLFLAAGRALSESGRLQRVLPVGALALLLAVTLPGSIRLLKMLSTPDTRLNALAWARDAFPSGSRVLRFAHTPEFSPRDPFRVTVDWENHRLEKGAGDLPAGDFDYLMYASYSPAADPVPKALSGGGFRLIRRFDDPPPAFPHDPVVYIYEAREKR